MLEGLSAICPSTGLYCEERAKCVERLEKTQEAESLACQIRARQQRRIDHPIFGLPARLFDIRPTAQEDVDWARAKTAQLEAALTLYCNSSTDAENNPVDCIVEAALENIEKGLTK